jgi:hypothetical protein
MDVADSGRFPAQRPQFAISVSTELLAAGYSAGFISPKNQSVKDLLILLLPTAYRDIDRS